MFTGQELVDEYPREGISSEEASLCSIDRPYAPARLHTKALCLHSAHLSFLLLPEWQECAITENRLWLQDPENQIAPGMVMQHFLFSGRSKSCLLSRPDRPDSVSHPNCLMAPHARTHKRSSFRYASSMFWGQSSIMLCSQVVQKALAIEL